MSKLCLPKFSLSNVFFGMSLLSLGSCSLDAASWGMNAAGNSLSPRTTEGIGADCRLVTTAGQQIIYITDAKVGRSLINSNTRVFLAKSAKDAFTACSDRIRLRESTDLLYADWNIWDTLGGDMRLGKLTIGSQTSDEAGNPYSYQLGNKWAAETAIDYIKKQGKISEELEARNRLTTDSWGNARRQLTDRMSNTPYIGRVIKWGVDLVF